MTAAEFAKMRAEFMAEAMEGFDRMFGQDGQNGLVTFDQREQRACEVSDALARWMMAHHVELDPSAKAGQEAACPVCGGPVRYESAHQEQQQVRELVTRRGKIEFRRAAARCPRCRKIFFPPGREAATGNRRLQPGDADQD